MSGMASKNLFYIAADMAHELDSLYCDNRFGRKDLLEFMEGNRWFGAPHSVENGIPMTEFSASPKLRDALLLWLCAYKKPGRDKLFLMLRHFSGIYPQTCELYRKFVSERKLTDNHNAWRLLDYLLSEIDKEITVYTEAELEELMERMETEATLMITRMFADFLHCAQHKGRPLTKWLYSFNSRNCPELVSDAYPADDFAVMAYYTFNEDMWAKQNLIEKAVQSKTYADLWLFVALHFICALRTSDMKRLPAPALPFAREAVLERIRDGTFAEKEAAALAEELRIRTKMKRMKPSKTAGFEGVPDLKLFVPESLKAPLGVIIAIALAHHQEARAGESFVRPPENIQIRAMQDFFGQHFARALGNKRFSSRRCNKSYLQGIDSVSAKSSLPGRPKGYMVAALARSHKSGIETLSKTTDVYLKDAAFTGYTPEFIIKQMFERGVFSFIPSILLDMYAGPDYAALPVSRQTELICGIGLDAHRIEWVSAAADRALIKSRKAVYSLLAEPSALKENVYGMLQNIASGNAPSKQEECLCLMTAAGFPCPFADRYGCIGCGYEIYTKTAMHILMGEYTRLAELRNSSDQSEAWRYERILEAAVLPAVAEMITAMKTLCPGADMTELLDIVERGIANVDGGAGRIKRQFAAFNDSKGD